MRVEYLAHFGDDRMVSNVARVSMNKWKDVFDEKDAKLIRYLAKHNHITPFFHPQIQLRITAPIFIARQAFRSTIGTARNEVSRRYVDDAPTFFEPETWRLRPEGSIKQGSGDPLPPAFHLVADSTYARAIETALAAYEKLLDSGVAPEQARVVLPQSMETMWVETGSLAYWARFYGLRAESHAQKEIQLLAEEIAQCIAPLFPVSWAALTAPTSPS
jgi:thymidylate synthase (FAD)